MDIVDYGQRLFDSVITDFISTVIVIPVVTFLIVKFLQFRKAARVWGPSRSALDLWGPTPYPTIVLATSSIYQGANNYQRPQTGIGQVRGLAVFGSSLARAYRSVFDDRRVMLSHDCHLTRGEFTHDFIVLGGPKTNSVTRELLETHLASRLPEGFEFKTRDRDGAGGGYDVLTVAGAVTKPHNDDEVVGMVLRCPNPLGGHTGGRLVVDGRNGLDAAAWRAAGWRYHGMGRP